MKAKEIREQNLQAILENDRDYCGRYGRAFELICTREKSQKTQVSKQGQTDISVKFKNADGKIKYVPCEVKTNGGRVDELLNGSKVKFVVYMLDTIQKHAATKKRDEWEERRTLEMPVIIEKGLFIKKLKEFNAIKAINRNGELDGYGIQVSSKKWYEWLKGYPVKYDNVSTYEYWEFEGLE